MTPVSHSHFIFQSLSLLPHPECQTLLVGETLRGTVEPWVGPGPYPQPYLSIDLPGPEGLVLPAVPVLAGCPCWAQQCGRKQESTLGLLR